MDQLAYGYCMMWDGNLFILLPPRTPYFNVGHGAELLTSDPPVCHTACQ